MTINRTPRQAAEAAASLLTHAMDARTTTQTAALFELAAERLEQAEMSGFAEEAEELAWNPAAPVQAVRELIQRIENRRRVMTEPTTDEKIAAVRQAVADLKAQPGIYDQDAHGYEQIAALESVLADLEASRPKKEIDYA